MKSADHTGIVASRRLPSKRGLGATPRCVDCIEACCEHAYSLYRVGDAAELVLENFYGLDV